MMGLLASVKATFIAAGVALAVGFGAGWTAQGWRWDAAVKDAYEEAMADFQAQQEKDQRVAREAARREAQRRERQREVAREVPNVVEAVRSSADCTADAELVGLWNEAARAAAGATVAAGGDAAVPEPRGDQSPDG